MNEVMSQGLQRYLDRLPTVAKEHYARISAFMVNQFEGEALYNDGSPVFVSGGVIVRVGLFADHANFYVRGSSLVTSFFAATQLTPKGMVQWFYTDPFPEEPITRWITAELAALPACTP